METLSRSTPFGPIALALSTVAMLCIAPGAARADLTDAGDIKAGGGLVTGSTTADPADGELELTFGGTKSVKAFATGLSLEAADDSGIDIFINENHNVGIGPGAIPTPFERLTIGGSIGFINGTSPLLINSQSGGLEGTRMFWGHSAGFPNWGIFYNDATDRMHYRQSAGDEFATFDFPDKQVGVGTATNPQTALHVRRGDGTAKLLVEETSATKANRTLFELRNNGGTFARFLNTNPNPDQSWALGSTAAGAFTINADNGTPTDLQLTKAGNLKIAGTLTQGSDRRLKEAIREVEPREVLERLSELEISTWRYRADRTGARHIGPMAKDFARAFGFGSDRRSLAPGDVGGVALAAIKAQQAQLRTMRTQNRELAERVAALEAEAGSR